VTAFTRFSLRFGIHTAILAWLACDLLVFQGPLHRWIERSRPDSAESIAAAKARGVVARVFHHEITRAQLDQAVARRLWQQGKSPADSSADDSLLRYAALGDLIDDALLRVKTKAHAESFPIREEEIAARAAAFEARFGSPQELAAALRSHGLPPDWPRQHAAATLQQEAYTRSRVKPLAEVEADEARDWFEQNRHALAPDASFALLEPEITRALEATRRHQAAHDFRHALRRFEAKYIVIFHDRLQAPK
jgi:hypothetical protein